MSAPPRVLVVCEDRVVASLAASTLLKNGYRLLGTVTGGDEAILKTALNLPDLVLIDTNIAGTMDAIDAAHYLFQLFHVPVLFIAGANDGEKLNRLKYAQPYGVVFRPFVASQILTCAGLALYAHADRLKALGKPPVSDPRRMMEAEDEAVIILDKRGRVLLLNTYASWMVDQPLEKVFMRHWRDVMMFVSDTTGEEIRDPVTDATKNMAGAIHDASTSLVTTTSKRRRIRLNVRPIHDNHGRLIAVIMLVKENKKTYL
jgi:CheY-like chemotaxis protein